MNALRKEVNHERCRLHFARVRRYVRFNYWPCCIYVDARTKIVASGARQGQALDLTPRTSADNAPLAPRKRKTKWGYVAVLVLIVVGGGVIVSRFLTSAIDYYCNVDEIGVREGCEADRRIRVQGTVEEGSLAADSGTTNFIMIYNNKELAVTYAGDPGGIFQECIPVVVHGRLTGKVFEANRIEVKHSNEYVADNAQRIDDAESQACSPIAG